MKKTLFILIILLFNCKNYSTYDIIILNGIVYDGSLDEPALVDIGIYQDEIVAIGSLSDQPSKRTIDASGLFVVPGFIDLHVHLDPIFTHSDCESHLRQGVTTSLGGPDGGGPVPFGK